MVLYKICMNVTNQLNTISGFTHFIYTLCYHLYTTIGTKFNLNSVHKLSSTFKKVISQR